MWISKITCIFLLGVFAVARCDTSSSASAFAVADAGYLPPPLPEPPAPNDPVVETMAKYISSRLQYSEVLGHFANFELYNPYDPFFKAGSYLLSKAGYYDPVLVKVVADAVEKVGTVTSQTYFDAIGYSMAKIWASHGHGTADNAEALALSFVNAFEVAACIDDLVNTQSVLYAGADALVNMLKVRKWTDYDEYKNLFHLFANEMEILGGVA